MLGTVLSPAPTKQVNGNFSFRDIEPASGVQFILNNSASPRKHQIETMISGVALFDYNNDGLLDIFFVNGAAIPSLQKDDPKFYNRLYRNNGDGTFTDVTQRAGVQGVGYSMGVAIADYDNDGFEDIYVTGVNRNQLLHNNGDGTFTDVTARAGVTGVHAKYGKTWAMSAGWFDYNNDGKLDLLVTNYVAWDPANEPFCEANRVPSYCSPDKYQGLPNFLYHNNGDGTFTDASEASGIGRLIGKGMGVAFADYDGDGFPDVFIANDTFRNFLFHNNRDGTFSEQGVVAGVAFNQDGKSIAGMGADFRDTDNDGRPDIFVTGMLRDTFPLFRNRGKFFEDVTNQTGVARASERLTGWGNGIFDFDNDGYKDLFVACGSILDNAWEIDREPAKLRNLLLRNEGNTYRDESSIFTRAAMHRGAAFGDLNNDGRIDVVTTSLNDRPEILVNESSSQNHWLIVKLQGTKSNRDGIGARIKIQPESGPRQYNHVTTSVGLASSSDRRVHFGLGAAKSIRTVEIDWPSGTHQVLQNVVADQILTVKEP
ncbi:MAG: CRTAC1 family protein [Bryobacteraceae bacterium]